MYVFHFSLMKILNFLTLLFIVIWCLAVAASTNRLLHYKTTLTHTAYSGIGVWNGMEWSAFNGGRFIGIIIYCVYCGNSKLFLGLLCWCWRIRVLSQEVFSKIVFAERCICLNWVSSQGKIANLSMSMWKGEENWMAFLHSVWCDVHSFNVSA